MTEKQQRQITSSMRVKGQVGGASTDRSYNYKLRATWITPGVARAAARLLMLSKGFSDRQANEVVQAVTTAGACLVK